MSDELERRMQGIDPFPRDAPIEPHDGPRARALREAIMSTPLDTQTGPLTSDPHPSAPRGRRRWFALAAGGVALAAVAVAGVAVLGGDDAGDPVADPSSVTYALAAPDAMAMCITLDEFAPDAQAVAFGGTVSSVDGERVVVDVDRWYQNGDADVVVLDGTGLPIVALDGVEFREGEDVLVSVFGGTVGLCGTSGPASPELQAYFDAWYGA